MKENWVPARGQMLFFKMVFNTFIGVITDPLKSLIVTERLLSKLDENVAL